MLPMNRRTLRCVLFLSVLVFSFFLVWIWFDFIEKKTLNEQITASADVNRKLETLSNRLNAIEGQLSKLSYRSRTPMSRSENKKRILVTGGAGFVGSHLVDRLMESGHEVIVADNFFTGRKQNVEHWADNMNFEIINHDIINPLYIEVDEIYHLASPASPPQYMFNAVKTVKTNTLGTINMLGLAKRLKAKILIASTSEVYGDPLEHPQNEDYWGNVNPIGPRACYDEGKRVAETLTYAYQKQDGVSVRVARIFNTFGPRMLMNDGRVVSNFILQNLRNTNITVYGDGSQTRSFQYVTDLINGLILLMNSNYSMPINLGNPIETSVKELAVLIKKIIGSASHINYGKQVTDDPKRRKPDIYRAERFLHWKPKVILALLYSPAKKKIP